MSYRVRDEVAIKSRARYGSRDVLKEIASTAHDDGVGWRRQAYRESESETQRHRTLAWRTGLTDRQIRRALRTLQELDEVEIVIARDGRRRFWIYRVIVGWVRSVPVDYERGLPQLEGRFWTPEELEQPKEQRPTEGHFAPWAEERRPDNMSGRQEGDERTSAPLRADISDGVDRTSATATRTREDERSRGTVQERSGTEPFEELKGSVPADAGASGKKQIDELVLAFAEELGVEGPLDRDTWGTWAKAFTKLAAGGVHAGQLRAHCRAYRAKWPHLELTAFALTKHWLLIVASLERSFFSLHRWVTETSWRIDDAAEVEWVIATAAIDEADRRKLRNLADEVRISHADQRAEFLRWVEHAGWALDEHEWNVRVSAAQLDRETKTQARQRRLQLRGELAAFQKFGLPGEERVA